jgi:DNA-binding NarL/FixJ family response regulator
VLQAGARGYVLKSNAQRDLIDAIKSLASHKPFFSAEVSVTLLEAFLSRPNRSAATLTNRERGVVQLIAEGHSNRVTAAILNISIKTVETHRRTSMNKLNHTSSASLVRYAIRNKIVEADGVRVLVCCWHFADDPGTKQLRP